MRIILVKEEIFQKNRFASAIYPFENRLDYAPYFYDGARKVRLEEFLLPNPDDFSLPNDDFTGSFLEMAKASIELRDVANFVSKSHVYLYALYCLEHQSLRKQFFWLLFDMIGPFWTPLPKDYHFAYWNGFLKIETEIKENVIAPREENAAYAAHCAAELILNKYNGWARSIKSHVEDSTC